MLSMQLTIVAFLLREAAGMVVKVKRMEITRDLKSKKEKESKQE